MDNNNVVKIGTALKWRNTFDLTKKYYQENVVTACGCVFRCKVLQAQGKSPIKMTDDQGHIVYTNTDVWDVLVDMAYYYNYAVDTRKLTQQMLDYAKKLDEAFQKQQKEIEALQKDNKNQWDHINDIEKINVEQQRELNSIHDTISCFSEGIWIDTLLWSNETIWDNNKYAITDDLQNQINELTATHRQDIEDLTDKHNSELAALSDHIVKQEKIQDDINTYIQDQVYDLNNTLCCFSTGVWENDLHWSEMLLWDNNKYAITDALAKDIKDLNQHLSNSDQAFKDAMLANAKEHGLVNDHLQKHDGEIKSLQDLIEEHDQQIIDLLDTLSCFSNGYWDDGLKWSNQALWENSNLMYDTFEDIYNKIADHQQSIEDLTKEIQKVKTDAENTLKTINETFDGFRKEHEGFRKEHEEFSKEHEGFRKEHKEITDRLDDHDILCEEQQREIDSLLYRISILTNGVWDNVLLWNNDSEWSNTDLNGSCHCPEDTEERLDELKNELEAVEQRVSDNASEIENVKQNAITEHRSVAYQLRAIGREQAAQDENLAKLGEHFSCYADGVWGDLFIWDNDLLWANQTGVVNEALTDLRNDLRDTRYKLNEANEDIMTNLSLIRANHQLIEGNTAAIQENKDEIESTQSDLQTITDEIRKEALTEHRQVAYQLRAIGRDQEAQNENIAKLGEHFSCFADGVWGDLFLWDNDHLWANAPGVVKSAIDDIHIELNSHQETLDSIIEEKDEHFTCFSDDVWCNSSVWDNGRLWPSDFSNFAQAIQKNEDDIEAVKESVKTLSTQTEKEIADTNERIDSINTEIDNINQRAEEHQSEYQEMLDDIRSYNGCFEKGEWASPFFWNDTDKWYNSPDVVSETENEIISHDNRLTVLESQFALFLQQFAAQQTIIEQQQTQLETFMDCFTVLNVGKWQNLLLWDNTSKWSNALITEAAASVGTGGASTVTVKSYDPDTATVTI